MENPRIACLELIRLESIYRTFVKMNHEERLRTINFISSRYIDDIEIDRIKQIKKINPSTNLKKKSLKKNTNYINAKKYLKNEKNKKATKT